MNKYIKQWCFAVFMLSLSSVALAAPKGICTPDNGVFHSTLDFSGYLLPRTKIRLERHLTPL